MKTRMITPVILCLTLCLTSVVSAAQFNTLLFTKTVGWHHESIHDAVTAMRNLANRHDFTMQWHEDASRFNDEFLSQFDVIVFINTTGDVLNQEQQKALQKFIQSGKGFVGVHAAADTEYDWPWYGKLVGHYFKIHPVIQTAMLVNQKVNFPGMAGFREHHLWTDEFYDFHPANTAKLNYLLTVDESTYDPAADWGGDKKSQGMGEFHPLAWYHEFDGGRSFYSALGHIPAIYREQVFLDHLYGGIYWAASGKGIPNKHNNN